MEWSPKFRMFHHEEVKVAMKRNSKTSRGFTLIELMVVVAILGVLGMIVAKSVFPAFTKTQQTVARTNIETLKQAIQMYRLNNYRIPDNLEILLEPDEKNAGESYLENADALLDPWGNPFFYTVESGSRFEIKSLGRDYMEGGTGEDGDISSKDTRSGKEFDM